MIYSPLILIAEDVPLNMRLMVSILSRLMPEAGIIEVQDGRRALEVVERIKVDLIFMDIQMPQMDGLEATRMIRQMEAVNHVEKPIPIVAVTAFTLNKEKELCFKTGMNDFLSKPLQKESVRRMLFKYLPSPIHSYQEYVRSDRTEPVNHHFDMRELVERTEVEEPILLELAQKGAANLTDQMQSLFDAIAGNNVKEIRGVAHTIKGIALNLSFTNLAQMAKRIETLLEDNQDQIPTHYQHMVVEVSAIQKLLNC